MRGRNRGGREGWKEGRDGLKGGREGERGEGGKGGKQLCMLLLLSRAEVWSLCWSPGDTHMATCSEDQSVRVWDAVRWEGVATLTGHKLAVTSVDWKKIRERNILVSCSDDRVSGIETNIGSTCSASQWFCLNVRNKPILCLKCCVLVF